MSDENMFTEEWLINKKLETREDAEIYLKAYEVVTAAARGVYSPIPSNWKPLSVRHPEIFDKAGKAVNMLQQNYWQIPYSQAKKKHHSLTFERWLSKRIEMGLHND